MSRMKSTRRLRRERDTVQIEPFPLVKEIQLEESAPPDQLLPTPDLSQQTVDTPTSKSIDPTYRPP